MYKVPQAVFRKAVMHIIKGARAGNHVKAQNKKRKRRRFITICATCGRSRRRLPVTH